MAIEMTGASSRVRFILDAPCDHVKDVTPLAPREITKDPADLKGERPLLPLERLGGKGL